MCFSLRVKERDSLVNITKKHDIIRKSETLLNSNHCMLLNVDDDKLLNRLTLNNGNIDNSIVL